MCFYYVLFDRNESINTCMTWIIRPDDVMYTKKESVFNFLHLKFEKDFAQHFFNF